MSDGYCDVCSRFIPIDAEHRCEGPPQCECGHLLAAGAYGGWWCPVHRDMKPHQYAIDAVRELHEKYLKAANELYALKQTPDGVPPIDHQTIRKNTP